MRTQLILAGSIAAIALFSGCETIPPGAERGPNGTMAYYVPVESNEPGVRIEANGEEVGVTPLTLKIFGDPDGTFHDFGSPDYVVQALPLHTNQYPQTAVFRTGHMFSGEDYIPKRIYFDMNRPPPAYSPAPSYAYPAPYYYGPPPVYFGPRIYIGPPSHRHYYRRY